MSHFQTQVVNGRVLGFVRRRYGARKTFTWVHWRDEAGKWHEYKGDPWPSVIVPAKDLLKITQELAMLDEAEAENLRTRGVKP